jgi:manganese-dependent inorganic pyrophosphatase
LRPKTIVTSYTNPDADGVCTALAVAGRGGGAGREEGVAVFVGRLDKQTQFILGRSGTRMPAVEPTFRAGDTGGPIILIDTHNPRQLSADFPLERVELVIDHHPDGDATRFPRAELVNEAVGAAATVVVERWVDRQELPTQEQATLLGSAILANTRNFTAPSTSPRDRAALAALTQIVSFPDGYVRGLLASNIKDPSASLDELLQSDLKLFDSPHGLLAIAQIEVADAAPLVNRPELHAHLVSLAGSERAVGSLLNIQDVRESRSWLIASSPQVAQLFAALGRQSRSGCVIACNRLVMRKTDLLPMLLAE